MARGGTFIMVSGLTVAIVILLLMFYQNGKNTTVMEYEMNHENKFSNSIQTVNWTDVFSFIPNGIDKCQQLFPGEKYLPKDFLIEYEKFEERNKDYKVTVGQSSNTLEDYLMYIRIVKAPFIKTVCETGFNGGGSTFAWLQGNPNTHVYSFDIGEHAYGKPRAEYLMNSFPGRLTITWGNSLETLPKFREEHLEVKCDLIVIDGGHTYLVAKSDFDEFHQMANFNNIVILDNYPDRSGGGIWMKELGDVWEQSKKNLLLTEFFHCNFWPEKPLGVSVGRYLF